MNNYTIYTYRNRLALWFYLRNNFRNTRDWDLGCLPLEHLVINCKTNGTSHCIAYGCYTSSTLTKVILHYMFYSSCARLSEEILVRQLLSIFKGSYVIPVKFKYSLVHKGLWSIWPSNIYSFISRSGFATSFFLSICIIISNIEYLVKRVFTFCSHFVLLLLLFIL